jgi:UDP-glucose 4-epimerase
LENTNFDVVSIDNFSNSTPLVFDRIKKITQRSVKNYNVDLCNFTQLKKIFSLEKNVVGIIHFAAFKSVPESVSNPYKYYNNNINSVINLLECCKINDIKNFIFSSSCSVYGNIRKLPVKESTPFGAAESPYAFTKQIGEEIIQNFNKTHLELQAIVLRYFNPVGAHKSGLNGELPINKPSNLVPVITQTGIGKINQFTVFGKDYETRDGSCIRDYVHVTDIAIAHIKALNYLLEAKNKTNFSIFNLGTGKGVTVLEAIKMFERVAKIKLNYKVGERREGDVAAIFSDTAKSDMELGWKPKYNLKDMMETAWQWELNLQLENLMD